jgi:hypothetical protein
MFLRALALLAGPTLTVRIAIGDPDRVALVSSMFDVTSGGWDLVSSGTDRPFHSISDRRPFVATAFAPTEVRSLREVTAEQPRQSAALAGARP